MTKAELRKDHPRGCGENSSQFAPQGRTQGSPPRMRGKHLLPHRGRGCGRITPADAGKTTTGTGWRRTPRDHPRGCGENGTTICFLMMKSGSPPRMRGKRSKNRYRGRCSRITPADAGKTQCRLSAGFPHWDHPRGCGENLGCVCTNDLKKGSPPRMRGKRIHKGAVPPLPGITPADAGKTNKIYTLKDGSKDHPRGCGENATDIGVNMTAHGSPPRMRGKQNIRTGRVGRRRITPADAGKTFRIAVRSQLGWDHPRGCGENRVTQKHFPLQTGSPPRMRGKRDVGSRT